MKNKLIALSLVILLSPALISSAAMAADKKSKKESGKKPEVKTETKIEKPASESQKVDAAAVEKTVDATTRKQLEVLSAAMHQEARAIGNDLRDDEEVAAADIAMLFQAAVERNDTIRFAINTLSRRDETGQPVQDEGTLKQVAKGLTRLAGAGASMVTGNPAGVLGADMVNQMLSSGTDPYQHRVTDADMVILAREIDKLQWGVIEKYYGYRYAKERLQLAEEARRTLDKTMDRAIKENPAEADTPMGTIMTTLVETAEQDEAQAKQSYTTARNELSLLTGPDAILALEQVKQEDADKKSGEASKQASGKPGA